MSDSARSLAWWISAFSLITLAYGDVASLSVPVSSTNSVDVNFLLGIASLLWATPIAHVAGVKLGDGDDNSKSIVIKPLSGGALCAVMQTFAWCTYALAAYLAIGSLVVPHSIARLRGLKTAIGMLGFFSQALANLSLDAYVVNTVKKSKTHKLTAMVKAARYSGLALAVVALVACVCIETRYVDATMAWSPVFATLVLAWILEIWVARSLANVTKLPASFREELWFTPARYAQLVSLVLMLSTIWIGLRGILTPQFQRAPLSFLLLGIVGFMAVGLGAMFVHLAVVGEQHTLASRMVEGVDQQQPVFRPKVISLFTVSAVACVGAAASHYLAPPSSPQASLFLFPYLWVNQSVPLSWHLALPVLAHVLSWLETPSTYALFAPFQGGPGFVALQGLGWLFFGLSSGCWMIWHVSKTPSSALFPPMPVATNTSTRTQPPSSTENANDPQPEKSTNNRLRISVASPPPSSSPPTFKMPGSPFPRRRKITGTLMDLADATVATSKNTVLLLTLCISFVGINLVSFDSPELILVALTLFACNALFLAAAYFKPFQASPEIVVQEALGWTVFAVATFGQIVMFPREANAQWTHADLWIWRVFVAFAQTGGLTAIESVVRHQQMLELLAMAAPSTSNSATNDNKKNDALDASAQDDMAELDQLIALVKRPRVLLALNNIKLAGFPSIAQAQSNRSPSVTAIAAGVCSVIASHVSLLSALASEQGLGGDSYLILSVMLCVLSCVLTHLACGPLLYPGYSKFQPFNGGPHLVVFQALGWTMAMVSCIGQLCVFSHGLERTMPGMSGGLGVVSWVGQICLLYSLKKFDPNSSSMGSAFGFHSTNKGGGAFLSISAFILLCSVDGAVVFFGLGSDTNVLTPLLVIGWFAVCAAVPFSEFYGGTSTNDDEGGTSTPANRFVRFIGLAAWTFSLLLGLLLMGHSFSRATALPTMLSTKTGVVGVVAHMLTGESARSIFVAQRLVALLMAGWFFWLFMPALRWFLDVPMYWYAYTFKTWKWSLSPDGKHPLENVIIVRDIPYGANVLDVIVPVGDAINASSSSNAPVCWTHGGGHLFCKRELMIHQVTPLARAGTMVVAIEYPLSPDQQFPEAVVCVLEALMWCRKELCRSGGCYRNELPSICKECDDGTMMTVDECCRARALAVEKTRNPCLCCPHRRGHPTVQLSGDSAGGSLAAMVAALLTNPHLLQRIAPHSGRGEAQFNSWVLPRVQRLSLVYGLLGRNTMADGTEEDGGEDGGASAQSWLAYAVSVGGQVVVDFCIGQYAGERTPEELRKSAVLNDLKGQLVDFPPETLMLCGLSDPLIKTNRDALKLIREATGREVRLVEYAGSTHAFAGIPPQWTFGRWLSDAFPATREMVQFHTGVRIDDVDASKLPRDFSPIVVFGVIGGIVVVGALGIWEVSLVLYGMLV